MNRKQKQWSPNSLCIKNFIILFSVVAISLAWTYLIYESMHHTNAAFGGGAGDLPAQKVDMLTGAASDPKRASLTTPVATSPPGDLDCVVKAAILSDAYYAMFRM